MIASTQLNMIENSNAISQRLRVLCVDDSTYNLFVIEELLKQIDVVMEIQTALNG